ncbi:S-layer homology domain-containing protein [Persephonella sp.]
MGDVWKGVNLRIKAYGNNIEKLFCIEPDASVSQIEMRIKGAESIGVTPDGRLKVKTEKGDVYFTKPVAYQIIRSKKRYIKVSYTVKGNGYGFTVGEYDKTKPLVIDPLLASTYLGGSDIDWANSLALDSSGNVYVAGKTTSADFPVTAGAYDESFSAGDAFISKLSQDLSTLIASTYLGGIMDDYATSIALDSSGNVYVTGGTYSTDFPVTAGAYDNTSNGDCDAFVSKLSSDLSGTHILSLSAIPPSGMAPLPVRFTCKTNAPDGVVVEYRWDFDGDGVIDETTTTNSTTYTYNTPRTYTAKVTVVDNGGAAVTREITIGVFNCDFTDISQSWAEQYITDMCSKGVVSGYPDGTYKPDNSITRAEVSTLIAKAMNLKTAACTSSPFSDVPMAAWYCPYVEALKSAGIIEGYPDNTYRPDNPVTRAEMAVFISRAFYGEGE